MTTKLLDGEIKTKSFCKTDVEYRNFNLNKCHDVPNTIVNKNVIENRPEKKLDHLSIPDNFVQRNKDYTVGKQRGRLKSLTLFEPEESKNFQRRWKTEDKSNNKSSSTLSLHIQSYENKISEEEDKASKVLNKVDVSLNHGNSFEFPRQQHDRFSDPAIMQFKASQVLLDPNQSPPSHPTPPPPPPPPPPAYDNFPLLTPQEFYDSLNDEQRRFFDNFKQKSGEAETELLNIKQQLNDEQRWNSDLLENQVPYSILNDKHECEIQKKAAEIQRLNVKIAKLENEFSEFQISANKKIAALTDEISKLKREKAINESRSKYVLDFHIPDFDDDFSDDDMENENDGNDEDDIDYIDEPAAKKIRLDEKYPESTWEKIIREFDSGKKFYFIYFTI